MELIGIFGDLNTVASMRICEFGSEAISKSEVFTQEFQTSSLRFRIMHVLMTCTRCLKMICSKIVFFWDSSHEEDLSSGLFKGLSNTQSDSTYNSVVIFDGKAPYLAYP